MTVSALAAKPLALVFAAAGWYAASHYPFGATWLLPVLLLYICLMCWRHQLWLFALPALIPVLDLAPWTGWFFVEEIDLLLLITLAFGYWHLATDQPQARLPGFAAACAGALTLAYLIGAWRGLAPLAAPDVNALNSYLSPYNSLRIAKAWFWALLLLPLLTRAAGPNLINIGARLIPGMLTGLALVSGAAIWERMVFPGLLNFSSDYRITAPFSGMHVGGAALDGYLALTFPLVALWLLTPQPRRKTGAAVLLFGLAAYAGLSTFSRGLFGAYACSLLIIGLFLLAPALRKRAFDWRRAAAGVLLAALMVFALAQMFISAGYRGFAAALTLLAAAFVIATRPIPWRIVPASVLCGVTLALVLAMLLPAGGLAGASGLLKPPYLLFSLATLAFGGIAWCAARAPLPGAGISATLIALTCMALGTLWIADHWAGPAALGPAAVCVALALALIGINARQALWTAGRASLTLAAAAAVILAMSIPIAFSYYAAERFAGTENDLGHRMRHWKQVIDMMDADWDTRMFGMGLGKFPVTYFLRNPLREAPASLHYADESGNRYLRMTAPAYPAGYGELLRLLQRVALQPATRYTLALDIRNVAGQGRHNLGVSLCERLLLYQQNCHAAPLRLLAPDPYWHHYQVSLDSGALGAAPWLWRAPVQIGLAIEGANAALDIDNISLRDELANRELVRNGAFTDANDYWFFSSDHYHLPWHAKNLALNVYFELGWIGLGVLCSLLLFAFAFLFFLAWQGQILAAVLIASLSGFLVVGLTDSLLDVPRLSLLFFLLLLSAVLRPPPRGPRRPSCAAPGPAAHQTGASS